MSAPDLSGAWIVHRASRTERLADTLAARLEAERPAHPLAAQTIVVAHPGLKRWLLDHLARRGTRGIAANLDVILPWQWFERVAHRLLDEASLVGGAWRRETLRWRILAALDSVDDAGLARYLAGNDAPRRRYQLAAHLAGLFTQYLIYRPDWVAAWERGERPAPHGWQPALWQHLAAAIPGAHRARRGAELVQRVAAHGPGDAAPIHVFGTSHIAPDVFATLAAAAHHVPVRLYFPDPCREYWSDLASRRQQLKSGDAEALYYEIGHPLLVALGRIAQDFCLTLDDADADIRRDALDEAEGDAAADAALSLLARVQAGIRRLAPELPGAPLAGLPAAARAEKLAAQRADPSLRIHACHTRLRELEVLRDALLDALAQDTTLGFRDIVVMAPDIGAYAPLIAAVFGAPGRHEREPGSIAWHLADVGLERRHPLFGAFARLTTLDESRFGIGEIMDLADLPAIARRFGLDHADRDALDAWLRRARIVWGLDGAMKAEAGAGDSSGHTWQFGLDRLYAGLIAGNDAPGVELLDGVLPMSGVAGNAVEAIGQLQDLLDALRRLRQGFQRERTLAGWSAWLLETIDALFRADPRDEAEGAALDALRRIVASLGHEAAATGLELPLPWSVPREALREALAGVPEHQTFLYGGVTFCGMVPQRSIPFRMVCLLGMNEGEFPRTRSDGNLNLMTRAPRRGDRDTRQEDRFLFLEALMAARDRFHVSYLGEGVRDGKPRNPAAPLAELLDHLDAACGLDANAEAERPWRIRHPLQPFDARYYAGSGGDPRLFSFDATFATAGPAQPAAPFWDAAATTAPAPQPGTIRLADLKRFWRDPVKDVLLRRAGISLEALEGEEWPQREPLSTRAAPLERIEQRLVEDALAQGRSSLPDTPPAWLHASGLLADGAIGTNHWETLHARLDPLLPEALTRFADARAQPRPLAIDLDLGGDLRLVGTLDRVYAGSDGTPLLFTLKPTGALGLKDLLAFYLDWAALRLAGHAAEGTCLEPGTKHGEILREAGVLTAIRSQDPATLRAGLLRLIGAAQAGADTPLPFFPKAAEALARHGLQRAREAWMGSPMAKGEREYGPGYASLVGRDLDLFTAGTPACSAFLAATRLVCETLDPSGEAWPHLNDAAGAEGTV